MAFKADWIIIKTAKYKISGIKYGIYIKSKYLIYYTHIITMYQHYIWC